MVLSSEYVNHVKNLLDALEDIAEKEPTKREWQMVKYEHAYDYYLGFYLGSATGQTYQIFNQLHNRDPSEEEQLEIRDLILLRLNKFREKLKKATIGF